MFHAQNWVNSSRYLRVRFIRFLSTNYSTYVDSAFLFFIYVKYSAESRICTVNAILKKVAWKIRQIPVVSLTRKAWKPSVHTQWRNFSFSRVKQFGVLLIKCPVDGAFYQSADLRGGRRKLNHSNSIVICTLYTSRYPYTSHFSD